MFRKIEKLIYIDKDYKKAISFLLNQEESDEKNSFLGLAYFFLKDYKTAIEYYLKTDNFYQIGYCYFLLSDLKKSLLFWERAEKSPAVEWGIALINIINSDFSTYPSFMQIRSFLEKDLSALISSNQTKLVNKILSKSSVLYKINPETYKFIGKALLHNKKYIEAKDYLSKSFSWTDEDPEIYFLLSKCYLTLKKKELAVEFLRKSVCINSNYIPAVNMLQKLSMED